MTLAASVSNVSHHYGDRQALCDLSLDIACGEIFALLGPNGGGKTTLFRLLSTLSPVQHGTVKILGHDVARDANLVRSQMGVVFQAPSVDKKLTVAENIRCQGHLYGLSGRVLQTRQDEMLNQLGLTDRAGELVETLSGGLRRRVELAKGMLHRPRLLLMDEPSTGLDPGARSDLWDYLQRIRTDHGVTVILTTHLLEEAQRADRTAILHQGDLVALDTPDALRASVGGDWITIRTTDPDSLSAQIAAQFEATVRVIDDEVRIEASDAQSLVVPLMEAFREEIDALTLGKPSLEDVFIDRTGHRFWRPDAEEVTA
jgi:ABC-2 type transport system ATP-binding protein